MMTRLIKTINSLPIETLILWKKFAYIKKLIKNALEGDLNETNPQLFAAFFCILGTLHISENDILSIDPISHISEQVKFFFDATAKEFKEATSDDLVSVTKGLIPLSESNEELLGRINILCQIQFLQHNYEPISGCFITLLAAVTAMSDKEIEQSFVPDEYSAYIDKVINKLKNPLEQKDTKEHFTKFFENKTIIIEKCVSAFEEVFENIFAMKDRFNIYKSYLKHLQDSIYETIKEEPDAFKMYFHKENSEDFSLLTRDYRNPSSKISLLLAKNEKLKKSFLQYHRAVAINEEKIPQPVEKNSYWKSMFG